MRIDWPWATKLGGLAASAVMRAWMGSLDARVAYYDAAVDPVFPECRRQRIFLCWHEYLLVPTYYRGQCNLASLMSRHRDAEILWHMARLFGCRVVRGSTRRGAVAAVREMMRESRATNLGIIPDGPRGPRRCLAPGVIQLASLLGIPVVVLGIGYDRPWRIRTAWDQTAIPRPFSRARVIFSPEVVVPPGLDEAALEHFRRRVEALLNRLTEEAEAWAASDKGRPGQMAFVPGAKQTLRRRVDPAQLAAMGPCAACRPLSRGALRDDSRLAV